LADNSYFEDPEFMRLLANMVLTDRAFLRKFGDILGPDDFKPRTGSRDGNDVWATATKGLEYWKEYREPANTEITGLLRQHAREARLGLPRKKGLLRTARNILKLEPTYSSISAKVKDFKQQVSMAGAMEELLDLQGSDALTTERWLEIAKDAVMIDRGARQAVSFFDDKRLEERILRRITAGPNRNPSLLIDPFDIESDTFGRGGIGLVLAPYGKGKSAFLLWLAFASVIQKLNVLYFTLEDPLEIFEDRMDSLVSILPSRKLAKMPNRLRNEWRRFQRFIRGHLRVVDGTMDWWTIQMIEDMIVQEKDNGFSPDVIIVDYDAKIKPPRQRNDLRHEFEDLYKHIEVLAGKYGVYFWTAAQANREATDLKKVTGKHAAEDQFKMRAAHLCLGVGGGEWGPDSLTLTVAKKKQGGRSGWSFNIMTDLDRGMFYDRDATLLAMKQNRESEYSEEEEDVDV
jgi:hypothetical protein